MFIEYVFNESICITCAIFLDDADESVNSMMIIGDSRSYQLCTAFVYNMCRRRNCDV